jgi:hypothetical protein
MSEKSPVTVRQLPDGNMCAGYQVGESGRLLELVLPVSEMNPGSLVEVESGNFLYLGEILVRNGAQAMVLVEHSLDREKLPMIQEAWQ